MKDCSEPRINNRLKRAVNTDIYDLEKGPIIILRDSEDSFEDEPENEEEIGENQGTLFFTSICNWTTCCPIPSNLEIIG